MLTDTAHFDTHQPAENVTFIGCVADGGAIGCFHGLWFPDARPELLYHWVFSTPGDWPRRHVVRSGFRAETIAISYDVAPTTAIFGE
jgi:hypothetical protein